MFRRTFYLFIAVWLTACSQQPVYSPYSSEHATSLAFPSPGRWYVYWGGNNTPQNYHVVYSDQRYAFDFFRVNEDVNQIEDFRLADSYRTDGKTAKDFYCFGTPIHAPVAGMVVSRADGVPDNVPGKRNRLAIFGNYVLLRAADKIYVMIAHMREGSVTVNLGDRVLLGQALGECGNSGNSGAPHIHLHVQDSDELFQAYGRPIEFSNIVLDGKRLSLGRAVRGQVISTSN